VKEKAPSGNQNSTPTAGYYFLFRRPKLAFLAWGRLGGNGESQDKLMGLVCVCGLSHNETKNCGLDLR
jgi:hypothetical protein